MKVFQVFEKKIDVKIYELSLFTANIEVQPYVAFSDESFQVKISVDYTFGKSMHGEAKVRFIRFGFYVVFEKVLRLGSESGTFDVNIMNDLGIASEELVEIALDFTDAMSHKMIHATSSTIIQKISTVLSLEAPERFKQRENFIFKIEARRYDGSPVLWTKKFQKLFLKLCSFFLVAKQNDSS